MPFAANMHSTMPDRKSNLAKYGRNHALESEGLALVRTSAAEHPILRIRKSAEGAKADFVIYANGFAALAIGVQLKTTKRIRRFKHSKAEFVKGGVLFPLPDHEGPRHWRTTLAHVELTSSIFRRIYTDGVSFSS